MASDDNYSYPYMQGTPSLLRQCPPSAQTRSWDQVPVQRAEIHRAGKRLKSASSLLLASGLNLQL